MTPGRPVPEDPFEALWAHREDVLYPALFGPGGQGIFTPSVEPFLALGATAIDPRWMTHGVWVFPPHPGRQTALYATSGISLPWEAMEPSEWRPDGPSGLGYELVLEVPEPSDWALDLAVHALAYALLISTEGYASPEPRFHNGSRMSWGGPLNGKPTCLLRHTMTVTPPVLPARFETLSGTVDLLQVIGLTDSEIAFARAEGSLALLPLLVAASAMPVIAENRCDVPGV